ncbi:AFL041Cp [Eremothecium gossypii ATCC 10895]|uniref:methylated diphthine methylhydrolase n=1 Tax=Eremothecium gossypii (strain ATCC 10895 / CBS 109.51 / FGSC 9923 / NRRL Y-1056) TaxID=284811 RepID=Q754V8_EREGS|nr:AFL041Cp [Eremothecium gossypii ATCC 10895]AAS53331.1 AFL041Cp [Eremothecium gossypii ATCC 10895]AEY97642.1 FAFL041Cp [Eremothecium gossypii FDAG1]
MQEITVLERARSEFPPCAVRIMDGGYVVVGTYELDKTSGARHGSIEVYDGGLQLVGRTATYGAVLDLKASPFDKETLVSAHSTGNVMVWRMAEGVLAAVANLQLFGCDSVVTSVNFSTQEPGLLVVTTAGGAVATVDVETGAPDVRYASAAKVYEKADLKEYDVQGKREVAADLSRGVREFSRGHSVECWIGEFGALSPLENVVFSGGDDCAVHAYDVRTGGLIWANSAVHGGGVVALRPSTPSFRPHMPTALLTGSYDDRIRSLDLRMMGNTLCPGNVRPLAVSELDLGGGVWRFVESPSNALAAETNELLVCCMYDGARIVAVDGHDFTVKNVLKEGHESMCYGADWCDQFAVTCSFYDKSLQLWKP